MDSYVSNEDAMIRKWKTERFQEQGFDDLQVACLIVWEIDPHDSEKLVEKGCDHAVALRILKPVFVAA